jgi:hypothetical protein
MKFENLYRIVINSKSLNEATDLELGQELADDTTADTQFTDKPVTSAPMVDPTSMSDDDKIEYLMKHSTIINKNPNRTDAEKHAQAAYLVKNDLFETMYDVIQSKLEAGADMANGAMEALPPDIESDVPEADDIEDISGSLGASKRLGQLETEEEEEALHGQDL